MDFNKSVDATAVHLLKRKQGDILRLPGVMYLDCHTNLALQVRYTICTIMYVSKPINKFKIARVRSNHCSKSSHHAISESKPTEQRWMVFRNVVANSLHFVIFVGIRLHSNRASIL